jgi:hypothetical protein
VPFAPLITLANVTDWLQSKGGGPFPATSNGTLTRVIASVSTFAAQYLQGPVAPITVTETYNGNGRGALALRQRPVLAVTSLTVGNGTVSARVGLTGSGYVLDGDLLRLPCQGFCWGVQNVQVVYSAGYQTADITTVPTPGSGNPTIDATDLSRPWNTDGGVAYATGSTFLAITTTPTLAGTYQLSTDPQGNAEYVFAPADAGAEIVVTYGYTPEDIQQALVELVGERFRGRDRIGEASQSLGGHVTTSFSQKDMNATIKSLLQPYRQVVPVP